jgi:hypothetical protein
VLKKIIYIFLAIALLLGAVFTYLYLDNSSVKLTKYNVYSKKVNPVFDGYKIDVISDFHNRNNYDKIITRVIDSKPNIIVLVGDLINMEDETFDNVSKLLDGITPVCESYFVSGNHETWSKNEDAFLTFLQSKNVSVINNQVKTIEYKNNKMNLIGYKDITYADDVMRYGVLEKEIDALYNEIEEKNFFNILLFHRGNLFDTVAKRPFDLVLSGHTHGGQINLPFINDRILMKRVNNTKYSKGYYRLGDCQMILSGGLEKNFKKLRLFNTPEVVEVTLRSIK